MSRSGQLSGYDECGRLIERIDSELSHITGRGAKRGREEEQGEAIDELWAELCDVMARFSTALFPAAGALGRTLTNAVTSSVLTQSGSPAAGNGAWTAAVTCAHIFPSVGSMVLTEVFEVVLQSGSLWDTPFVVMPGTGPVSLMGGSEQQQAISHRLSSLAQLIEASVGYVEPKLACRFASQFAFNTTPAGIAIFVARSGAAPCHPHSVLEVLSALLVSLRPCPASVLLEASARCSGSATGLVKGSPAQVATAASHRAYFCAVSRLRNVVDLIQHPRVVPFYRPPNLVMDESVKVEGIEGETITQAAILLPRAPAPVQAAPPQAPTPKVAHPTTPLPQKVTIPAVETAAPVTTKKAPLTMADIPELDM